MLQSLYIENFAIIDRLELDFNQGLTVVTGETGAGKSIIMDALGMVLGDRADSAVVPPDSKKSVIVASFDIRSEARISQWLDQHDLLEDHQCLIKRTLSSDGRSKAFINDQPVTLSMLKQLAEFVIDIHGQHAHHALLKPLQQLKLLDQFAGHQQLVHEVSGLFQRYRELKSQLQSLQSATKDRADRKTLLQYQLQELDEFALTDEEVNSIEKEHQRLSHANELKQTSLIQLARLSATEDTTAYSEHNVSDILQKTLSELSDAQKLDNRLSPLTEQLQSTIIEITEVANELRHYTESLILDPERLFQIEQRLSLWHDLARKHHIEPSQLVAHHQALTEEYRALNADEDSLTALEQQTVSAQKHYFTAAKKLSRSRRNAASQLEEKVAQQLTLLGMKDSILEVRFESHEDTPSQDGLEKVSLFIQPNPGLPAQPLNKIASGGELSRISLAIQVVTVSKGTIPVMVFDEVDVGIGGATAEIVGKLLKQLAESAQILC
ncbi:MAG TPA: DNA repair protein RecN, partial [Aeromonadales bacterium]|nr:DNA repair protein RecN [Aeromonadales bacterium]